MAAGLLLTTSGSFLRVVVVLPLQPGISYARPLCSRLSFPATEPPDPRRVSEGFEKGVSEGSLKGFRRVFTRVLEGF